MSNNTDDYNTKKTTEGYIEDLKKEVEGENGYIAERQIKAYVNSISWQAAFKTMVKEAGIPFAPGTTNVFNKEIQDKLISDKELQKLVKLILKKVAQKAKISNSDPANIAENYFKELTYLVAYFYNLYYNNGQDSKVFYKAKIDSKKLKQDNDIKALMIVELLENILKPHLFKRYYARRVSCRKHRRLV